MNKLNFESMKTKNLFVFAAFALMILIFSSFSTEKPVSNSTKSMEYQNGLIVYATYMGMDGKGYAFEKKAKNGKVVSFTFHHIEESALKKYDLKSDALIGSLFKITFNKDDNFTEDTQDDKNTITDLEKG